MARCAAQVWKLEHDLPAVSALERSRRLGGRIGYTPEKLDWYKSLGGFTEIIAYRTRLFLPVDRAETIVATLTGIAEQLDAAA